MTTTILPRVPSKLLGIALADLEEVEKLSEVYVVDMGKWHTPNSEVGKCIVCFAGSVMARSLKVSPNLKRIPVHFRDNVDQLFALDFFRNGQLVDAGRELGIDVEKILPNYNITVPDYDDDDRGFKVAIRKIIREFEKVGF